MAKKNSSETIGNRSRDLPVCSAVDVGIVSNEFSYCILVYYSCLAYYSKTRKLYIKQRRRDGEGGEAGANFWGRAKNKGARNSTVLRVLFFFPENVIICGLHQLTHSDKTKVTL
jgi:hypothetical protein